MADPLLLVVEGPDDLHVISNLLKHHSFRPPFKIQPEDGYQNLQERLSRRLKPGTDLERLGIVVDADVGRRWQSVKGTLARAGYTELPDMPDPAGTVVDHDIMPRVGVWIMPDNVLPGMLEDYLAFLVPPGDTLLDRARHAIAGIPEADRRFADVHHAKALIHTWLAWQEDPGTPMGQAITKRYLDADSPRVAGFLAWLARLFG